MSMLRRHRYYNTYGAYEPLFNESGAIYPSIILLNRGGYLYVDTPLPLYRVRRLTVLREIWQ